MRLVTRRAAAYLAADHARARFLILAAGYTDGTRRLRDAYLGSLGEAIDSARSLLDEPRSVSQASATVIAASVWELLTSRLQRGGVEDVAALAGELSYLIVMPYWGVAVAEAELHA